MRVPKLAVGVALVTLGVLAAPAGAQEKKANPKAAELETKLLDVPEDMKGDWLKAWRENLLLTYSEELTVGFGGQLYSGQFVRFTLENKTPCTLKVTGKPLAGLTTDGRPPKKANPAPKGKDAEKADAAEDSWTIEPGKKLVIWRKPVVADRVMAVPLKNDLNRKVAVSALSSGPLCRIQVIPTDKETKPIDLAVVTKVGSNGTKALVSGYFFCKPGDERTLIDSLLK